MASGDLDLRPCISGGSPKNYLWDNGKAYGNLGGFAKGFVGGASVWAPIVGYYSAYPNLSNTIYIYNNAFSVSSYEKLNFDNVNTLYIEYYAQNTTTSNSYLGVTDTLNGTINATNGTAFTGGAAGSTTIYSHDVSAVTGEHYIGLTTAVGLFGGFKRIWWE